MVPQIPVAYVAPQKALLGNFKGPHFSVNFKGSYPLSSPTVKKGLEGTTVPFKHFKAYDHNTYSKIKLIAYQRLDQVHRSIKYSAYGS